MDIWIYSLFVLLGIFSVIYINKYRDIVLAFIYCFLVLIMGLAYGQADYDNYIGLYERSQLFDINNFFDYAYAEQIGYSKDFGYTFLCKIFNSINFSYADFKFTTTVFFLGLLFFYVSKITKFAVLVITLYMIYPFFMDVIQVRNFIIEVLLFVSIYYLSIYRDTYKYIIIVLLSATIHASSMLYMPFFIFLKCIENKVLRYVIYIVLIFCISMPLYSQYITSNWAILKILFLNASDTMLGKYGHYIDRTYTGTIYPYLYVLMTIFFLHPMCSRIKNSNELTEWKKRYVEIIYKLHVYLMFFFPLYPIFSEIATRMPRNCILLLAISISIYLEAEKNISIRICAFIVGVIFILSFGFIDLYYQSTVWNVDVILKNNFLLEIFYRVW